MNAFPMRRAGCGHGQALVWFAFTLPVVVLALALVADGTLIFAADRRALELADAAARAAASQIDILSLRADPNAPTRLDVRAAQSVADAYVLGHEPSASVDAQATPEGVKVVVRLMAQTALLHPVGGSGVQVVAQAQAQPFRGVDAPQR